MRKQSHKLLIASLFTFILLCGLQAVSAIGSINIHEHITVTAAYVTEPPVLDGDPIDAAWINSTSETVILQGDFLKGFATTGKTVTIKFVYTDTDLYMLAQWPDPTLSFFRGGSWIWDSSIQTWKHPSGQSEDRIAVMWNINVPDFETEGCTLKCHGGPDLKTSPHAIDEDHAVCENCHGKEWSTEKGAFFNSPGLIADMWHMKAARALPYYHIPGKQAAFAGWVDDKHIGYNANPATYNTPDGGRYGDSGSSAYYHNRNKAKTAPLYMETNPTDFWDAMVITESEIKSGEAVPVASLTSEQITQFWSNYEKLKAPVKASYSTAVVPERILREPQGSRGDVMIAGYWKDGTWTVEIKRSLITGHFDDVQFDDLTKTYYFDVAVMDNTGGEGHSFHIGSPLALVFSPKPVMVGPSGPQGPPGPRGPPGTFPVWASSITVLAFILSIIAITIVFTKKSKR